MIVDWRLPAVNRTGGTAALRGCFELEERRRFEAASIELEERRRFEAASNWRNGGASRLLPAVNRTGGTAALRGCFLLTGGFLAMAMTGGNQNSTTGFC